MSCRPVDGDSKHRPQCGQPARQRLRARLRLQALRQCTGVRARAQADARHTVPNTCFWISGWLSATLSGSAALGASRWPASWVALPLSRPDNDTGVLVSRWTASARASNGAWCQKHRCCSHVAASSTSALQLGSTGQASLPLGQDPVGWLRCILAGMAARDQSTSAFHKDVYEYPSPPKYAAVPCTSCNAI